MRSARARAGASRFRLRLINLALISLCCIGTVRAHAGGPVFKVGGLAFGDAYHVASHHTEEGGGAAGLVLRRAYLTFNANVSDDWFGRLRFEGNQSGKFEDYDLDGQIKDLYAGRKFGKHRVVLGLSPTPTYDLIESTWGLRYLEKTPLDLQGVASRDTGISASGPVNGSGTLSYRAMFGTDVEFESDSNDSRKWMGALTWRPAPPWVLDFYLDFEDRNGPNDRSMVQLFAAYRTEAWRWGIQYSNQDREDDPPLELASVFAVYRLGERASLVGRVDRLLEPSPKGNGIAYLPFDPTARATLLICAVEFRALPYLAITPNIEVIAYDRNDQGVRPDTDTHFRLTFYVDFE